MNVAIEGERSVSSGYENMRKPFVHLWELIRVHVKHAGAIHRLLRFILGIDDVVRDSGGLARVAAEARRLADAGVVRDVSNDVQPRRQWSAGAA